MELPFPKSISQRVFRASSYPRVSKYSFVSYKFGLRKKLNCNLKPFRVKLRLHKDSSLNLNKEGPVNVREESEEFVEVIGIGSQKDAVLDFCLASPFLSPGLRFWNILVKETVKVQLQQRLLEKDTTPRIVETPLSLQSCSKAVVAGAAYGTDFTMVLDVLEAIKFAKGFVVGIILKPFSFEGRRRQDEVNDLVDKLQGLTNFYIMVDADALLEKDLVTLDEALKTANNAVLMAINAISILLSGLHIILLDVPHDSMKELKVPEIKKILGSYKEARVGFGAGYNIKTSIIRAIYDCPFLGPSTKDLNGVVVFILASSSVIESSNVPAILHTFRQATECKGEIIASVVHDPNLDPNLTVTTIITLSCDRHEPSQQVDIFSKLAQHFPFIFNILRKPHAQSDYARESSSPKSTPQVISSKVSSEMPNLIPMNGTSEDLDWYSSQLQSTLSSSTDQVNSFRKCDSTEHDEIDSESPPYNQNTGGQPTLQRELLIRSGHQIVQECTSEPDSSGAASVLDNLGTYKLPVGVKPSGDLKDGSTTIPDTDKIDDCNMKIEPPFALSMSWDTLNDASLEAMADFRGNTSAMRSGEFPDASKKNGALSVRAASMLEAERDSQKKWSPKVEIKYREGIYVGRCQGGLPEGKGHLSLGDGSIYDGMWHYGKRSGLGSFCFCNGDVFRGYWRDDLMHGKGWFYFHTGDRLFVNFWKGKANGEGRFYSEKGDIFFGNFKDGWRDGHFLCINVDGSRYLEIWEEGVLVSRKQVESDAGDV